MYGSSKGHTHALPPTLVSHKLPHLHIPHMGFVQFSEVNASPNFMEARAPMGTHSGYAFWRGDEAKSSKRASMQVGKAARWAGFLSFLGGAGGLRFLICCFPAPFRNKEKRTSRPPTQRREQLQEKKPEIHKLPPSTHPTQLDQA